MGVKFYDQGIETRYIAEFNNAYKQLGISEYDAFEATNEEIEAKSVLELAEKFGIELPKKFAPSNENKNQKAEIAGVVSYFLIGFEYFNQKKSIASKKVFIINRIGDTALNENKKTSDIASP